MFRKYFYQSPIGILEITEEKEHITGLNLVLNHKVVQGKEEDNLRSRLLLEACTQLDEYFSNERTAFDLPIQFTSGTPFQHSVWNALRNIPYGETRTYGQIAAAIGSPKAARAVGQAVNRNPIWIVIPCHRIVGAGGKLTGYAGGLELKQQLLDLEQLHK